MNRFTRIQDFHGARKLGVGSSDIPTLAGLNKRWGQTPLTLWREKTGKAEGFEGNERTEWGNYLEPLILRKYVAMRYGDDVAQEFYRNSTRTSPISYGGLNIKTECFHPEYPFCLAHADLIDTRGAPEAVIVEAKSAGFYGAKRREGAIFDGYSEDDTSQDGIPDKVFLQVQWQLFCYGLNEALVPVLIDTANWRLYGPIIADPRTQEKLLALAIKFWDLVTHDTPPTPTTWDDVVSLNPVMSDTTAIVSGDVEANIRAMIAEGHGLKDRAKDIAGRLEDIKDALGIVAGKNRYLTAADGSPLATLRDASRETYGLQKRATELKKSKAELTPDEKKIIAIDAEVRELGLVTKSEWREVRY